MGHCSARWSFCEGMKCPQKHSGGKLVTQAEEAFKKVRKNFRKWNCCRKSSQRWKSQEGEVCIISSSSVSIRCTLIKTNKSVINAFTLTLVNDYGPAQLMKPGLPSLFHIEYFQPFFWGMWWQTRRHGRIGQVCWTMHCFLYMQMEFSTHDVLCVPGLKISFLSVGSQRNRDPLTKSRERGVGIFRNASFIDGEKCFGEL